MAEIEKKSRELELHFPVPRSKACIESDNSKWGYGPQTYQEIGAPAKQCGANS
jgi:hypothetical protein